MTKNPGLCYRVSRCFTMSAIFNFFSRQNVLQNVNTEGLIANLVFHGKNAGKWPVRVAINENENNIKYGTLL